MREVTDSLLFPPLPVYLLLIRLYVVQMMMMNGSICVNVETLTDKLISK